MKGKLTLSINTKVVNNAKEFCHKKGISVSKLVEEYLQQISKPDKIHKKYLVDEIIGVIHNPLITPDNWKELLHENRNARFLNEQGNK